jgi:hypothetical protein
MKTLNFILSLLLLNLCIVSCGKSNSESDNAIENSTTISTDDNFNSSDEMVSPAEEEEEEELPPPPPEPPIESKANSSQNTKKETKIIKDGDISISCVNLYKSKKVFDKLTKKYKGYYSNEKLSKTEDELTYELEIRIPSSNFEQLVHNIENGKDEITEKNINTRDVSEEYYDLETRLENKKAYLKRYKELLNKANSIAEILAIEENIRTIQEEIESSLGRLNYLKDQIGYSTLNIYLSSEVYHSNTGKSPGFFTKIGSSLGNGIELIMSFLFWIISIWPIDILIILIAIWFNKKRKKKLS